MTPDEASEVQDRVRDALIEIAFIRDDTRNRVRVAHQLGIRKNEIAQLSGLARSTVDRYLGHTIVRPGVIAAPPPAAGPDPAHEEGPGAATWVPDMADEDVGPG